MRIAFFIFLLSIVSCDDERPCQYKADVVDYYIEVTAVKYSPICKWTSDFSLKAYGSPLEVDIAEIIKVIDELNDLQDEVHISLTEDEPNVEMHFIKRVKFDSIINVGVSNATGLAGFYSTNDTIQRAIICIASDESHLPTRMHAIREELTQILGLGNDNYSYPNSIFWEGGGYIPTEYLEIDKLIIQMHYSDVIKPGMTAAEVEKLVCWK